MEQSRPALARVPAESLFVLGAVSQYVGAALAVLLFDAVPAAGVAWLRVVSAAAALAAWRRPWRHSWAGESLRLRPRGHSQKTGTARIARAGPR